MPGKIQLVIDASVVIKWFHQENKTDRALKLLEEINAEKIKAVVPDLMLYEVANALVRGIKQPLPEAYQAIAYLTEIPWHIVSPTATLLKDAMQLANEHQKLSVYDALYVAVAMHHNATVITDDTLLHRLVGKPLTKLL